MKIYLFFCFLLPSFLFLNNEGRLAFLYTHFRHGARGPKKLNDNFVDGVGEKWTSLAELTGVGERMHYLLGLRNRKKYIEEEGFLSPRFDPHQMLIFTTTKNRTMISCYSQLQGLYPQRANISEELLTPKQEEKAYPPILEKDKDPDIEKAIKELDGSALPYRMMLAPARMVSDKEIKMSIHNIGECKEKTDKIKKDNEQIQEFKDFVEKFNKEYAESFNKYYKKEKAEFKTKDLTNICGAFLADYTEDREMKDFKEATGLDFDKLKTDCLDFYKNYYFYSYYGDKDRLLAVIETSKMMREFIFYMKRRLDADMTEVDEDADYRDYSRPRWILTSGHESTVSANNVLLIKALDLDMNTKFYYPKYAAQLALEIRTKSEKCKSYSDYNIIGYFDNNELFNIKVDEFINKVESIIWTDQQVDEFCGYKNEDDDKINKTNKTNNIYKILMIVFICLTGVLLILLIILGVKFYKFTRSETSLTKVNKTDVSIANAEKV